MLHRTGFGGKKWHVFTCVYMCLRVFVCVCAFVWLSVCLFVFTCGCVFVFMRASVRVCR